MPQPPLEILYEDNHLLAVNKPAGLPTMGTPEGRPTLLTLAKEYIKQRYGKPGNVYLGVVSRLDAPVTGVVLWRGPRRPPHGLTEPVPHAPGREDLLGGRRRDRRPTVGRLRRLDRPRRAAPPHAHRRADDARRQGGRLSFRRLALLGNDTLLEVDPGNRPQAPDPRCNWRIAAIPYPGRPEVRQPPAVCRGHRPARPAALGGHIRSRTSPWNSWPPLPECRGDGWAWSRR